MGTTYKLKLNITLPREEQSSGNQGIRILTGFQFQAQPYILYAYFSLRHPCVSMHFLMRRNSPF